VVGPGEAHLAGAKAALERPVAGVTAIMPVNQLDYEEREWMDSKQNLVNSSLLAKRQPQSCQSHLNGLKIGISQSFNCPFNILISYFSPLWVRKWAFRWDDLL
jgi:hypothetical protein